MSPFGPYVPGMEHMHGLPRSDPSPALNSHRSPASRGNPISNKSPGSKDVSSRGAARSPTSSGAKSPGSRGTTNSVRTPDSRGTPTWVQSPGPRGTPTTAKPAGSRPHSSSSSSLPKESREALVDSEKLSSRGLRDNDRVAAAGSASSSRPSSRVNTPSDKSAVNKDRRAAPSGGEQAKRSKHSTDESDRRQTDCKTSSSVSDYYFRNPMLSAEAAAQSASTLFFPFGMPSPFSSPALMTSPFAGSSLFPYMPTASGSVYSPSSLFGADGAFTSQVDTAPPSSSSAQTQQHHAMPHHSKVSTSNSKTTCTSRGMTSLASSESTGGRARRSPHHGNRNQPDTDWRDVGGGSRSEQRNMTSLQRDQEKHSRSGDAPVTSRKVIFTV